MILSQSNTKPPPPNLYYKRILFQFIVQQFTETPIHSYIYITFLIIENIQMLYYSLHSRFIFLWKNPLMSVIQNTIKYSQSAAFIESFSSIYFALLLFNLIFIIYLPFILIIRQLYRIKNKQIGQNTQITSCDKYIISFINYFALSFKTYLYIPSLYLILSIIFNSKHANLLSNQSFYLQLALNLVGLIIFIIFTILFYVFYNNSQPFTRYPAGNFQYYQDLYKAIIKSILPIYFLLDSQLSAVNFFVVFLLILYITWLILIYKRFEEFCFPQRIFKSNVPVVCGWAILFSGYQISTPNESSGIFFLIISFPIVIICWRWILEFKYRNILAYNLNQCKNQKQVLQFLLEIIQLIQQQSINNNLLKLYGVLSMHFNKCCFKECYCQQIINKLIVKQQLDKLDWYKLIKDMMTQQLIKFPQSFSICLLLSYVYLKRLNNKYKAIYYRNKLQQNQNASITMRLKSYIFMKEIQFTIEKQNMGLKQKKNTSIKNLYHFHIKFTEFRNKIFSCSNKYLEFWKQLLQQHPQGLKINQIAQSISSDFRQTQNLFKQLKQLNPNNIQMLIEFNTFMKHIRGIQLKSIDKQINHIKILNYKKGKCLQIQKTKYGQNSQIGIVVISANQSNMGQIIYSNNHMLKILQFRKHQFIKQNLKLIIPPPFQTYHQEKLANYVQGTAINRQGIQKTVFMQSKSQNIIYGSMILETLPDITEGVCLVGYFSPLSIEPQYILCDNQGKIYGISKKFTQRYDIRFDQTQCIKTKFNDLNLNQLTLQNGIRIELQIQKQKKLKTMKQLQCKNTQVCIRLKQKRFFTDLFQLNLIVFENSAQMVQILIETQLNLMLQNHQQNIKEPEQLNQIDKQLQLHQKDFLDVQDIIQGEEKPQKLKILMKSGYTVIFLYLILATSSIPLFFQKINYVNQQIVFNQNMHFLRKQIIDMAYMSRVMNAIARSYPNITITSFQINYFKSLLAQQLSSTNNYYSLYNTISQILASRGNRDLISQTYNYYSISPNSWNFNVVKMPLSACILQYLTSISNLQNATAAGLNFTLFTYTLKFPLTSTQQNFIDLRFNALYSIIPGLIVTRTSILDFYECLLDECYYSNILIFFVSFVLTISLSIYALHINIKFANVGFDILGLFGNFNKASVQNQIKQIQKYLQINYRDLSVIHAKQQSKQLQNKKRSSIMQFKATLSEKTDNQLFIETGRTDVEDTERQDKKLKKKLKKTRQATLNVHENGYNFNSQFRSAQLKQSKLNKYKIVFMKYSIIGLFVIAYFLSDYLIGKYELKGYLASNRVYDALCQRIQLIQAVRYFTTENFFNKEPFLDQTTLLSYILLYVNQLYEVERFINSSSTQLPQLQYLIQSMNQIDLCRNIDLYRAYTVYNLSEKECLSFDNQALTKGLKSSIISWLNIVNQMYLLNYDANNQTLFFLFLNSPLANSFFYMPRYIITAIQSTLVGYNNIIVNQTQRLKASFLVKYSFFVLILIIACYLWILFIQQLKSIVDKIKGLILIITFKKIQKNSLIKKDILDNKILEPFR